MKRIEDNIEHTCCKKVKHSMRDIGVIGTSICGKKATHQEGDNIEADCRSWINTHLK